MPGVKEGNRWDVECIEEDNEGTIWFGTENGIGCLRDEKAQILQIPALSGCFVFARGAKVPLFDALELINQDLSDAEQGLSSFGGEILRFNEAAARLDKGFSFIAMDEFARGTNTEEGEAIARAAAGFLAGKNAVTLLTTHYDRTAQLARRHYQVKGLSARETKEDDLLEEAAAKKARRRDEGRNRLRLIEQAMDYGLVEVEPGTRCPRDAIAICRLLGMDEAILSALD